MTYSQEQIDRANDTDLVDFLRAQGEEVIKSGSEYRWKRHDSVTLRGNQYYQHSSDKGGYPIDFVMDFWNKAFQDAVSMLIHEEPEEKDSITIPLPDMADDYDHVMRYLTIDRGLDQRLVQRFLDCGMIYEEKEHHNLIFLGKDKDLKVRYAHARGTTMPFRQDLKGSDKSFGFCWRGAGTDLYVFEAPIDMMSFINMYPDGWKKNNYLALGGVSSKAIHRFLSDRPDTRSVYLCLDSDEAGENACRSIADELPTQLDVFRIRPELKDWNEMLKAHKTEPARKELLRANEGALHSMTMTELYDHPFPPKEPIIEGLLFGGTYIFAGAPKVGKSFLMLQIAYHVATGTKLWRLPVQKAEVLYLALEDDYSRLQKRLYTMFGIQATSSLHLAIKASTIAEGLMKQINEFVHLHPDIRLIIVDTLQKIRESELENYSYAKDYETITALKTFSDQTGVCILVVHHTRKTDSSDSFEMISGTNGLLGAADGGFILHKESRISDKATLNVVGRDIEDLTMTLKKNSESLVWELDKFEKGLYQTSPDPLAVLIAEFMSGREPWTGTASELLKEIPSIDIQANVLIRKLNVLTSELYNRYGIRYTPNPRTSGRKTFLLSADKKKMSMLSASDDISSLAPG